MAGGSSAAGLTPGRSRDGIEARDGSRVSELGHWRGMGRGRPDATTGVGYNASAGLSNATRVQASELRPDVWALATLLHMQF